MEPQAWFKIVDPKSHWDKVSLEGVEDVADLKQVIKRRMEPVLNGYPTATFTIKATYNDDKDPGSAEELDAETKLKTVLEQVPSPVGSSTKKFRFFVILPPAPGK
ncbi:hypothetical protein BGX38DRAFT_1188958 [Terfezia claveryi]|nr:hypothetical protein BGX38DRAFT_1188958 [Terfezia claveryi]